MIAGHIDEDWQAIVPLIARHGHQKDRDETIDFLIDTGFTGFLSLSPEWVQKLDLSVIDIQRGMTADGRVSYFETVDVCILWHDQPRVIRAQVLDEPLIGTRLLRLHQTSLKWVTGERFELQSVPESSDHNE